MKYLSILMMGVVMLIGGCVELEQPPVNGATKLGVTREVSTDEREEREGIAYIKGKTEPFTGNIIEYYEDGLKCWEMPYVDGKKHGTKVEYTTNGRISGETPYLNGLRHGMAVIYDNNRYYEVGCKMTETSFVEGKKHGLEIAYFPFGKKFVETPYVNNKIHGTQITYHTDGSREFEITYYNGIRHGVDIWYDKNGLTGQEVIYENGKKISDKEF